MSFFKDQGHSEMIPDYSYHKTPPQNFNSRIQMLESNLTRVTNQHQALIPLLALVQLLPQINKNMESAEQIRQKLQNLNTNMQKFSNLLKQNISHGAFSSIDNNFKSSQTQIQQLKNRMKQLELNMQDVSKQNSNKLKQQSSIILSNVEKKITNSKNDILALLKEFKKTVSLGAVYRNPSQIQELGQQYLMKYREYYENQFQNIKREIGLLQCEMEYLMDIERTNKIRNQVKNFNQHNSSQKNYKIGNVEQRIFLEQFQNFDNSNTSRLQYEISLIENQLEKYSPCIKNIKSTLNVKNEMNFLQDRIFSIKSQIWGTKQKEILQGKRLRNRMNKIFELEDQLEPKEKEKLHQDIKQTQLIKQKLEKVYADSEQNHKALQDNLNEVQQKFRKLEELLN